MDNPSPGASQSEYNKITLNSIQSKPKSILWIANLQAALKILIL